MNFDAIRPLFANGRLSQGQVDGVNAILAFPMGDVRFTAYALATAFHETAQTMEPIHEFGGPKYFHDRYDIEGQHKDIAQRLGNTFAGDGVKFHGRGLVQLTGRANYQKMSVRLGLDLVGNPDLVLDDVVAVKIMGFGMVEGLFTTRKLSEFFNATTNDAGGARRIINGQDQAAKIASYFNVFLSALR